MDDPFCKRCGTLLEPAHCSVCQTTAQEAHLENKITSLEAENDRLREALTGVVRIVKAFRYTNTLGKSMACFCPLDAPCHADVLLRIANE